MGIFSRIFGIRKINNISSDLDKKQNDNIVELLELKSFLDELLKKNQYISKREFLSSVDKKKDVLHFFDVLIQSQMLENFCKSNRQSVQEITAALDECNKINEIIDFHNEQYIKQALINEREYFDGILKKVDKNILLDEDQRRVILTDEDYCLVIAGAGAGKTTTVAAKVKFLVDKKNIKPSQILVVSFTNKAVNELKEKINKELEIDCPIATFHSVGNAIININTPEEKLNIVDQSKLYFVIRDYFRNAILQNESIVNKLIMFFASYFDAPYEGDDLNSFFNNIAKANFSTLRSDLEDFKREIIDTRTKKSVTIQNEVLRSQQEVEIANFLYLNNIEYEYEPIYQYNITYYRKPYTPDFIIYQDDKCAYIEHFGITESGKNNRYSDEELTRYKKAVNDKVRLHNEHGTVLIYTFSGYNDNRPLIMHLKEELESKGFKLKPRSNKEIMEMLVTGEENRYIRKLLNLICRFISNFKVNGYSDDEFNRMYHSTQNVRSRLFLDICNDCYLEYERWLNENKAVDFEDMINESAITKNNSIVSDYVEIIKADLEPILFNKFVLNDVIYIILNALQNISVKKYYNKTILINVLIECNNKIIIDNNLIQIPEYGQLKNMSYDDIDTIIEWMINKHLILRTKERYPVLHSTYEGLHYSKYIGIKEMKQLKEYLEKEVVTWKW